VYIGVHDAWCLTAVHAASPAEGLSDLPGRECCLQLLSRARGEVQIGKEALMRLQAVQLRRVGHQHSAAAEQEQRPVSSRLRCACMHRAYNTTDSRNLRGCVVEQGVQCEEKASYVVERS
jgi:hypothetical protein